MWGRSVSEYRQLQEHVGELIQLFFPHCKGRAVGGGKKEKKCSVKVELILLCGERNPFMWCGDLKDGSCMPYRGDSTGKTPQADLLSIAEIMFLSWLGKVRLSVHSNTAP